MLAYAASRPRIAQRRSSPNAMLVVIDAHVAMLAIVMSAKMDIHGIIKEPPLIVDTIKIPPPPNPTRVPPPPRLPNSWVRNPVTEVPLPPIDNPPMASKGPTADPGPIVGAGASVIPNIPHTIVTPAKSGPQLLTPASELKPPYPPAKLLNEEEATLMLRLTIDRNGRVTAVDPVGRTDSVFLAAARRHLIGHWRYKPATEGGQAVTSSTVITLRFQLDG